MSEIKVLKFGGTSMRTIASLKSVLATLQSNVSNNNPQVVVCSAMGGVTDKLLEAGQLSLKGDDEDALTIYEEVYTNHLKIAEHFNCKKEFIESSKTLWVDLKKLLIGISMVNEFSEKSISYLSSFGERLSTFLLYHIAKDTINCSRRESFFIRTIGKSYVEDDVDWINTRKEIQKTLQPLLVNSHTVIVTGFFAQNPKGYISLLGRGGSDYSASIIAVSLHVKNVEIWTDVDGFMTADPRIVENAYLLDSVGFKEVSELCFFGAKILHPKTIKPLIETGGTVTVKNTFNKDNPGTLITGNWEPTFSKPVLSISSKNVVLISLDLFTSEINMSRSEVFLQFFTLIHAFRINIDAIAASEAMISFCIEEKFLQKNFIVELKKICAIDIRKDRVILCIVSPSKLVINTPGILAKIFNSIASVNVSVEMDSENASEVSQLVVIKKEDEIKTIKAIHEQIIE